MRRIPYWLSISDIKRAFCELSCRSRCHSLFVQFSTGEVPVFPFHFHFDSHISVCFIGHNEGAIFLWGGISHMELSFVLLYISIYLSVRSLTCNGVIVIWFKCLCDKIIILLKNKLFFNKCTTNLLICYIKFDQTFTKTS